MKTDKFHSALLDAIEQNQDIDPRQVFGQMIQLAAQGLYDMAPNYPTAQAVINISLQNGLDDHMDQLVDSGNFKVTAQASQ